MSLYDLFFLVELFILHTFKLDIFLNIERYLLSVPNSKLEILLT